MASGTTLRRERGRFAANLARSAMNEATEKFSRGGVSHAQLASAKGVTGKALPAQPEVC